MPDQRPIYKQRNPRNRRRYMPPEHAGHTPQYEQARNLRSSVRWVKLVAALKQQYPVCQWCDEKPSEEGHHVKPVAKYPELAYSTDNVLLVCRACHELIESAVRRGIDINEIRGET